MKSWSENYATNIEVLDEQHKELFNILDNCYDLILNNKEEDKKGSVNEILDIVASWIKNHILDIDKNIPNLFKK